MTFFKVVSVVAKDSVSLLHELTYAICEAQVQVIAVQPWTISLAQYRNGRITECLTHFFHFVGSVRIIGDNSVE